MSAHTKDAIMAQAQVFASSWSLVGGRFDNGNEIDNANQQKADLAEMIAGVVKQRDDLLALMIKVLPLIDHHGDARVSDRMRAAIANAEQKP